VVSSSKGLQWSVVVFIAVTLVSAGIVYIYVTPPPRESFFRLYVLGEGRMFENYFPNDNATISPGVPLHWYLGVTNLMGSVQYVAVKAKLGNATTQSPSGADGTPAPVPVLIELRRVLLDNETWEIPLTWKVTETRQDGDVVSLALDISGVKVEPMVHAVLGTNFRMMFELWTLTPGSSDMSFGWVDRSSGERRATWIQVRFNVTAT